MGARDYLAHLFVSTDAVKLGRFVVNPAEPHQDYLDPSCQYEPEVVQRLFSQYAALDDVSKERKSKFELGKIVSSVLLGQKSNVVATKTNTSAVYQLANSRRWFESTLKNERDRQWLNGVIGGGDDIYVIVGYQTMADAGATNDVGQASNISTALQIPGPETAAALAGPVAVIGDLVTPALNVKIGTEGLFRRSFIAPGTQICAIQYRQVHFKWYLRKDLDQASLEKGSRWVVHGRLRGQAKKEEAVVEPTFFDSEDELEGILHKGEDAIL